MVGIGTKPAVRSSPQLKKEKRKGVVAVFNKGSLASVLDSQREILNLKLLYCPRTL